MVRRVGGGEGVMVHMMIHKHPHTHTHTHTGYSAEQH